MATDPARLRRLNQALMSVYYYGRRSSEEFSGGPPREIEILPLQVAVTELIYDPREREAIRPMRLAILDLCRTRWARPDSDVDTEIARLARAIATNGQTDPDQLERAFANIFQAGPHIDTADDAYVHAMNLLAPPYDSGNREMVQLVSYKEGLR